MPCKHIYTHVQICIYSRTIDIIQAPLILAWYPFPLNCFMYRCMLLQNVFLMPAVDCVYLRKIVRAVCVCVFCLLSSHYSFSGTQMFAHLISKPSNRPHNYLIGIYIYDWRFSLISMCWILHPRSTRYPYENEVFVYIYIYLLASGWWYSVQPCLINVFLLENLWSLIWGSFLILVQSSISRHSHGNTS